jgi:outer membrane protein OmpA-like peptidoglycan-associated protein
MLMKLLITLLFTFSATLATAQSQGEPSFIKSVFFRGGSAYINFEQSQEIQDLLDSIPHIKDYLITVHSHTDNIGDVEYNQYLSNMRSESAIEELVIHEKIEKSIIEIKDFGLFNPVYDNDTWYGRRMNRRVDIIFWLAI